MTAKILYLKQFQSDRAGTEMLMVLHALFRLQEMDAANNDKRMSAEYPPAAQLHSDSNDGDILPTSIADIEDILQYEGEEVTIDSQQTTVNLTDDDADVYLEISSADEGGIDPDECTSMSQPELMANENDNSLDDGMVIVEESTADFDELTTTDHMKTDLVTDVTDERLPSYEVVEAEKKLCLKLIANDDDRRTVIMNAKTAADDRMTSDARKASPSISKNPTAPELICGHTVNLLNNNKILIKSVKTTNSASASPILGKDEPTAAPRFDKIDDKPVHASVDDSRECRTSCDSSSNSMKMGPTDKGILSKAPSFDGNDSGPQQMSSASSSTAQMTTAPETTMTTATATTVPMVAAVAAAPPLPPPPTTSTPKLNREFEMLTKTVNESKVLTEFIIDQSTRGRRSLKASTKRKQQLIPNTSMGSELSTVSGTECRNESPLADARSRSKESDKSGTSGSGANATGKRSTRSQNSDFSAKQRRFLKGIQQLTRGTDDESENSAFDDDDDDIDYGCVVDQTKQANESGASFAQPKIEHDIEVKMSSPNKVSFEGTPAFECEAAILIRTLGNSQSDSDTFCWRCHQGECQITCSTCIRAYHFNCVKVKQSTLHELDDWQCPECVDLLAAESDDKK